MLVSYTVKMGNEMQTCTVPLPLWQKKLLPRGVAALGGLAGEMQPHSPVHSFPSLALPTPCLSPLGSWQLEDCSDISFYCLS